MYNIDIESGILLLGLGFLLLIAAGVVFSALKRRQSRGRTQRIADIAEDSDVRKGKVCFIINPSKVDAKGHENAIRQVCETEGVDFEFKYTTIEHPGNAQAVEAIDEGFDVIVACGGDGTVRSVACGIAKYADKPREIEMAVIPLGTGNILARNLLLPVDDIELATRSALTMSAKPLDVGFLRRGEENKFDHTFIVIAGVGFDANMINNTRSSAKDRIGHLAYWTAGAKEFFRRKASVEIKITTPSRQIVTAKTKLRSLMVGNCGEIPGFKLIPNAKPDDGILDVVAIDTAAGFIGWSQLAVEVFMQNFGAQIDSKYKLGRIEHIQATTVDIRLHREQNVQLDGDIIGKSKHLLINVRPKAVNMRMPKL